jgi:transcriptional regulator with XRE-family HTH domain
MPEDFGRELKEIRTQGLKKHTREELSGLCGRSETAIKYYENGRLPDLGYLFCISEIYEIPLSELTEKCIIATQNVGKIPKDFNVIYSFSSLKGDGDIDYQNGIIISDDSMVPTVHSGATVRVESGDVEPKSGSLYLISLGEQMVVRRLQLGLRGELILTCDNKHFNSNQITDVEWVDLVIGRVKSVTNHF